MIYLLDPGISNDCQRTLSSYQAEINAVPLYEERVETAKILFTQKNRTSNSAFREVRNQLNQMCSGNRRCCYCEDLCADEVEHILPKDLYPNYTFEWENYLYACGSCNGPKRNRFGILNRFGNLIDVTRGPKDPVVPPHPGLAALINPREEDPTYFFDLDIFDTFMLIPSENLSDIEEKRARYTISVLSLNSREVLVQGRKIAYGSYRARLFEYIEKSKGNNLDELQRLEHGIRNMGQPTVWVEIKRQHALIPEMAEIFAQIPEALRW